MEYSMYESPYRNLVVGVNNEVPLFNGSYVPYINFDNAATTPPFCSVMDEINNFAPWYSSIHRGNGYKSQLSSKLYDSSREIILKFVNGNADLDTVIYVKNATEGINKLSNRLFDKSEPSVILSTNMEHHSNDLPWRDNYKINYVKLDKKGRLSIKDLEEKLIYYKGSVKLVTVSGASNVTGFINPIYEIARLAHKYNAQILVDGAQLVPHVHIDMKPVSSDEHIDYLVFSAHKMYAPFGIGVLIGPKSTFEKDSPDYKGGGTVKLVTHQYVIWDDPPSKEEAGTPNVMGVVALTAAIKTLSSIGMKNVDFYEKSLLSYALSKLRKIEDIEIYGSDDDVENKVGIISFNVKGMHHSIISEILSYEAGIGVRTGCFCAHPYVHELLGISGDETFKDIDSPNIKLPGMVRISFGLYNNFSEIDYFINALTSIVQNKDYYLKKYSK